jgi:TP901 family phage tail tape measure protein
MPSASTVAELAVVITADTKPAEQGLASLGKSIEQGFGVGIGMKAFDLALDGVTTGLKASIGAAADFEQTMSGVKAVSGANKDQMDALAQTALDLGAKTAFSASEAGKGIEELVKGGLTVQEAMTAAEATLNLAAAGGISVADSATIAANALAQFNLPAEQMAHVSDLIAGAANASALDVGQFKYSLQAAGAVASTVGFNFDDLSQAIAVMGKAGITGSDAGTSLKTMMLNLQPSTKKQSELMRELGLITEDGANQFFDASGKVKSMADVAGTLQTALAGMTEQQKIATLNTLFGSDAIRAGAVLAKEGAEGFNEMAAAMGKVSAESVGAEKLNNLSGSIEQLKGSLETMGITIGLELLPILKDFVDALTAAANDAMPAMQQAAKDVASTLKEWMPTLKALAGFLWDNRDAILAVGVALATFAILTTVIGWVTAIAGAIGAVTAAISASGGILAALGALVAILGGPVTLVVAAVAAAVALLAYAWANNWGDIRGKTAAVVDFLSGVPDMISGFFDAIARTFDDLVTAVEDAWTTVETTTETVWDGIKAFLSDWWRVILVTLTGPIGAVAVLIIDHWNDIKTATDTIFRAIANLLTAIWDEIYAQVIKPKVDAIALYFSDTWEAIKTATDTIFRAVANVLVAIWDEIYAQVIKPKVDAIKLYLSETWEAIRTAIDEKMQAVSTLVATIWETVKTSTATVLNAVLAFVRDTIFEPMRAAVEEKINAARTAVETAITGLKTAAETALNPFLAWWRDTIWGPISAAVGEKMDAAKTAFETALNGFKTTVDTVMGGVKTAWETMWGAIERAASSPKAALEEVKNAVKALVDVMPTWLIPHSPTPFEMGIRGIADAVAKMQDRMKSFSSGMGDVPGELADWIDAAIAATGASKAWASGLAWIAMHESGGKPHAVNPEAVGNEHASGIMQTLPSTFASYAESGMKDIFNPVHNIAAAINYINAAYVKRGRSLDWIIEHWAERGGYASGGWAGLHGPELAWLGEKGPEYVVPNSALRGGGSASPLQSVSMPIVIGDRVIEELWITGRDLAIRRGRVPGAGAASMGSLS